jgi:tetratricopeptide (TPR) repeat protein
MRKTGSISLLELSPLASLRLDRCNRSARTTPFYRPRLSWAVPLIFLFVFAGSENLLAQSAGQSTQTAGSIRIQLVLPDGTHFGGIARVRVLGSGGAQAAESPVGQNGDTIIGNLTPSSYTVEASAQGFVTIQETVNVETKWSQVNLVLTMKPEVSGKAEPPGLAAPILSPRARKEVEAGLAAFRQKDLHQTRKHFEKALLMAPGNPDVQFLMGALEMQEKNVGPAKDHLEKAVQLFPNHVRALELLGELDCEQGHPREAIPLLQKAVSLEDGSWKAHWNLGEAYLQANEMENARLQAERAIVLGKAAAGVAQILEAEALAGQSKWDAAEFTLGNFIQDQPNDPSSKEAQEILAELKRHEQNQERIAPLPINAREDFSGILEAGPRLPSKNSLWAQPGVDEFVPPVAAGVSCSLPSVLKSAGKRVEQLMASLERFGATEDVTHYAVDKQGELRSPETRRFEYVVSVAHESHGIVQLEEYRNGSLDMAQFPAQIATEGLPAMALVFHPEMAADFNFECEGLGSVEGRPAWQVHFQQRPDRPARIQAYVVERNYYNVALKGRAWIDAGTFQVVRLDSELARPIPKIQLKQEHMSIEYAPVQFHSQNLQLWLPHTAQLFVEWGKMSFYRTHTFSDFRLFSVGTEQTFEAKESYSFTNLSDQKIDGRLTITPVLERAQTPVSITFTIPPRDRVTKTVGRGKDLDIPADWIAAARFVYYGAPGAVEGDASLTRTTTLEIVPEPQ